MTIFNFMLAILASNTILGLFQFLITRHLSKKDLTHKTLAAVSYNALADKVEKALDRSYATPEQRRDVQVLYTAYKENGWNGDMDSRMQKFYALPTKDLSEVYPDRKEDK